MIEQTRKKLREAQFFHGHLVRESERHIRQEAEAFDFYLSAFLSAARSITYVLQKEEKEKYDCWFPSWGTTLTPEEQKLMGFMNEQRVAEVHQLGAQTATKDKIVRMRDLPHERHGHPGYGLQDLSAPWAEPAVTTVPVTHFEIEGYPAKVVEACAEYLRLCERLVKDFAAAHS